MPEFRKNPVTEQWVIIATERTKRPREFRDTTKESLAVDFCPFCTGNEDSTPDPIRVYRDPHNSTDENWTVRVVPNKFPALRVEGELGGHAHGIYDVMHGVGAHEVIIEAPEHIVDLSQLRASHIATILSSWRDRIADLKNDQRLKCVVIFKNHGAEAGATLEHLHSQLIALPMIPKALQEELDGSKRYFEFRGRCVFCDMIHQELDSGARIIFENDDVVALAPYASRFPFETWILPKRHCSHFESADRALFEHVGEALQTVVNKLNRALNYPAFNLLLHSAPFVHEDMAHFHWHLELLPKLTRVAGFEWSTDYFINPTPSEVAAKHLRNVKITEGK